MYKIAAVGDSDSVMGFAALGLSVFECDDGEAAKTLVKRLAENGFAVIYITEYLASFIMPVIEQYADSPTPAIILIPGVKGNTGEGIENVRRSVVKAVGSDIIFNK
ncbi:MAG: V-type ATP synthase subunit F [Clostridia bacterium]|nr:V-type ATP synthase subunit F [Clostridia bacterium]